MRSDVILNKNLEINSQLIACHSTLQFYNYSQRTLFYFNMPRVQERTGTEYSLQNYVAMVSVFICQDGVTPSGTKGKSIFTQYQAKPCQYTPTTR